MWKIGIMQLTHFAIATPFTSKHGKGTMPVYAMAHIYGK